MVTRGGDNFFLVDERGANVIGFLKGNSASFRWLILLSPLSLSTSFTSLTMFAQAARASTRFAVSPLFGSPLHAPQAVPANDRSLILSDPSDARAIPQAPRAAVSTSTPRSVGFDALADAVRSPPSPIDSVTIQTLACLSAALSDSIATVSRTANSPSRALVRRRPSRARNGRSRTRQPRARSFENPNLHRNCPRRPRRWLLPRYRRESLVIDSPRTKGPWN